MQGRMRPSPKATLATDTPQLRNATIAIETRGQLRGVRHAHLITRKSYLYQKPATDTPLATLAHRDVAKHVASLPNNAVESRLKNPIPHNTIERADPSTTGQASPKQPHPQSPILFVPTTAFTSTASPRRRAQLHSTPFLTPSSQHL